MRSFLLALALSLSACNFRDEKVDVVDLENLPPIDPASLNYATVNEDMITPYCLGCHANAGGNQGELNLETYANVQSHLEGIRLVAIVHRSMPPNGALPAYPYALLKAWIEAGAPEVAE